LAAAAWLAASLPGGSAVADAGADRATPGADAGHAAVARGHRTFGVTMDLGVPDGAAVGVAVRPRFDWLRLGASATYNGMAPGVRVGVTLDPFARRMAPTVTVEGGHAWDGSLAFVKGSPTVGYDYANLHVGVEVGHRETFRLFLRGGVSWVDVHTADFRTTSAGAGAGTGTGGAEVAVRDPSFNGWVAPSAKLGFSTFF